MRQQVWAQSRKGTTPMPAWRRLCPVEGATELSYVKGPAQSFQDMGHPFGVFLGQRPLKKLTNYLGR